MAGKYRDRTGNPARRSSKTGRLLTIMSSISSSQLILSQHGRVWCPPTDVYETSDCLVVKVEVAGMAEDDFALTFADRTLVIAGTRRDPAAKLGYHQMEILYGEFRTDVYVPEIVDVDGIEASYQDGFLLVTLPKSQPHRVTATSE
jgi:HSP20 family protein